MATEFPKSEDAILSPSWIDQKNPSDLSNHIISEIEYIDPVNLNYDLLKQALFLENSIQNNRNLQTSSWKTTLETWTTQVYALKSAGKPSSKDRYIAL